MMAEQVWSTGTMTYNEFMEKTAEPQFITDNMTVWVQVRYGVWMKASVTQQCGRDIQVEMVKGHHRWFDIGEVRALKATN